MKFLKKIIGAIKQFFSNRVKGSLKAIAHNWELTFEAFAEAFSNISVYLKGVNVVSLMFLILAIPLYLILLVLILALILLGIVMDIGVIWTQPVKKWGDKYGIKNY